MMAAEQWKLFKAKCLNPEGININQNSINLEQLTSKSGVPTLKLLLDDKEIFVHSAYDPIKEAGQWAGKIVPVPDEVYFIFGFGLGYHVVELVNTIPDTCKIVIVEAYHEFIVKAIEANPKGMEKLLKHKGIFFITGREHLVLEGFLGEVIGFNNLRKVNFLEYHPVTRIFKDSYDEYKKKLTNAVSNLIIEMNTILHFSETWLRNFFINMNQIIMSPGVARLYGKFSGKSAIIVSAGPSLNKNIHLLHEAKGKSVIIGVGTSLKPLLQANIEPDLVISVDGGQANFKHFKDIGICNIPLVFDMAIYPEIPGTYPGPKLVGSCQENQLNWAEKTFQEEKGLYEMGPSVACVAFDLGRKLGCSPIILIGQDLAYTNNMAHAKGTAYDHRTVEDFEGREIIEVEGVDGNMVLTDRVMATFIRWFEIKIYESKDTHRVIDATEGGAKIPGTDIMTLKEAISRYCSQQVNAAEEIAQVIREYVPPDKNRLEVIGDKIKNLRSQLSKLEKAAGKGITYSRKLMDYYDKGLSDTRALNKVLRELEKIDKQISELKESTELFVLMFQKLILKTRHKIKSPNKEENQVEKGMRIASCSMELYEGIRETAELAGTIVDKAAEGMQKIGDQKEWGQ
ncbi:motility associated factor glycosyltransferase family protein [Phosphitispora sp. TUW77]|uniref:motility associated factor glycosyltransferase family protein n=1 Tax=Phosphitispora sp. TUW77 TaxID=3152361 RepID=UPI003AB865AD